MLQTARFLQAFTARSSLHRASAAASHLARSRVPPPHLEPSVNSTRSMATAAAIANKERFLADKAQGLPVCSLNIAESFKQLTQQEKSYAHYMSAASWAGARIIMRQTTPQAEKLFNLLIAIFSAAQSSDLAKLASLEQLKSKSRVSDAEWADVLAYSAQVLSNLANFRSFGATKFVPRVSQEAFEAVIKASERADLAVPLWNELKEEIYALEPEAALSIGKPSAGHVSAYYPSSPAPSDEQVDEVQALCDAAGISTLNTRLSRESDSELVLHIAAASSLPTSWPKSLKSDKLGFQVRLEAGDCADALAKINTALVKAKEFARDENQVKMLDKYVESFKTGDIEAHKDASRHWVKDVGPVVETYIGFIESYVDPFGARAEFEGFVAVVNKEQSRKYNTLVDRAPELIEDLPWGKDYEVPEFKRPDFTSLEIISFATGGIPAGINIPNYHDVREQDGFKNVSLQNILSAKAANEPTTFIAPEEVEEYKKWEDRAFSVQVANHELLGHGTGRLFQEQADGSKNFDPEQTINPLTGKPITSWYKPGETYGSRIGPVSSSMEECRAESVALYLASNRDIASIFGLTSQQDQDDLAYYTFVVMARAGVRALEWFDPATGRHGQAHMEARLGITNWMLDHGLGRVEYVEGKDGQLVDAFVRLDRRAVLDKGKEVMGKLLVELQVRKSTGDGAGATEFYKKLTKPKDDWVSKLRPLVLAKKLPRKVFVQPNTRVDPRSGEVELVEYPTTVEGVIQSFVERAL